MKKILIIISVFLLLFLGSKQSYTVDLASSSSAKLEPTVAPKPQDNRVEILEGFLLSHDSPLAPYASDFVRNADKYNLDWRLVASIAGLESTFGKKIPHNSYNAWGWGVYGDNVIRFRSWTEGIEAVSKGIGERYLKEGQYSDPYIIGPTYAASPTWAVRITFFMNKMKEYKLKNGKSMLSLAL